MAPFVEPKPTADEKEGLGSEDEDEDFDAQQPANADERRRAQRAYFDGWLTSDAGKDARASKARTRAGRTIQSAENGTLSLKALMAKQSPQIIENPRDYQVELFERAKTQNTIAVLDTGSGKTLIAVLLLRWMIDQELERRAAAEHEKISFFLVASVPLVFQQSSVLESNIDHPIIRVCGAMNCDTWSRERWVKHFAENKVVVCTAEILQQCLQHGFITMKQINLLIFDEAHHAKGNHVYARIMKDFYVPETNDANRPRIFGMTASPVDAKINVVKAAQGLESILHSRIATASNMTFDRTSRNLDERVRVYQEPPNAFNTLLAKDLIERFGDVQVLVKRFQQASQVAADLGVWCAEYYLLDVLSESRMRRYEIEIERRFHLKKDYGDMKTMQSEIASLKEAIEYADTQRSITDREVDHMNLSDKVRQLLALLEGEFLTPSETRCIVFVEARRTARMLDALCKRKMYPHLSSGFIVGTNNPELDEDNFSNRQQVLTLTRFRKGELNCLFATSVAEEGLDVTDCNVVIRFDMYRTMIQYIQSRGRARQRNSRFFHMLANGNLHHRQMLVDVKAQESEMRSFCRQMPEDRLITGNEDVLEGLMQSEKSLEVYVEPSTQAKLTYHNAMATLAIFVSAVPVDHNDPLHPTYIVASQGMQFIAEVVLPEQAPISSVFGRVCTKKLLAKCSAAFNACMELRKKGLIDQWLLPVYQKRLPAMRNALLAADLGKRNAYTMRTKPDAWALGRGTLPTQLWMTIIDFPDGLDRKHRPLALLTRARLMDFPAFPIYPSHGKISVVQTKAMELPLSSSETIVKKLAHFTFRVFNDVFSKRYEEIPEQLSYWLAPVISSHSVSSLSQQRIEAIIDWTTVEKTADLESFKWTTSVPSSDLVNKFIIDPWDGGRKFFSTSINSDLAPSDPVPQDCATHKWNANILDYSCSMYKNTRMKMTWTLQQPVIEAEKVVARRNMLAIPDLKEQKQRTRATLCPEPLRISTIPCDVAASCFAFPAVIHRLESHIIAMEACELVGITCEPATALSAVTKDSDNSGDHETQDRINFQPGMGKNYERLEFMGDCFLKTATTISTFIQNPNDSELEFHVKRMVLLCNKNLYEVAKALKTYEYIRSIAFSRRLWYPEGLTLLQGKGAKKTEKDNGFSRVLGQKTIADVSEALIGAAFFTHNRPGQWHENQWDDAIKAVTILVGNEGHRMLKWDDYRQAYTKPEYQLSAATASQRDLAAKITSEHDYTFNYPPLLRSAFTHGSQPRTWEDIPNYQRLEFLGDALLDLVSIAYLFYKYPDKDPQWLTEHKMAMVSNRFLGACCINVGFHRHLRFNSAALPTQIESYETELLEAKRVAGGKDYWTTVSDPPKCLPDIVESFVGALFIDSDFDWNQVQHFFDVHIKGFFEDMSIYDGYANDHPCTRLQNLLKTTYRCEAMMIMAKELPAVTEAEKEDIIAVVMVHNKVVAYSKGTSGRYAKARAAKDAAETIEGMSVYDFRVKYQCSCKVDEGTGTTASGQDVPMAASSNV
ncbi:dsRNA-specific nuclease [Polychaeton citri CBS 116435]|uniref:Dicer-like protein 1 n=1 Tax=Polychaeton citri CBS 116435 TaxID=1314669 RepID=A0A9P4Q402_9PEZI|nr:dsRNA-specific nuclease [Polychaeton citri CBS 116435]